MRYIRGLCLLLLFVLGIWGCEVKQVTDKELDRIEKDNFHLQIHSEKDNYETDEIIHFWATLEYAGKAQEVTIGHGSEYVNFEIKQIDGDLQFKGGVDFSYNLSTLEQDTEYITEYTKSGGYMSDDPNAEDYENFYSTSDVYLPEGEYKIIASANFEWVGREGIEMDPIEYQMPAELNIKIVEPE